MRWEQRMEFQIETEMHMMVVLEAGIHTPQLRFLAAHRRTETKNL
jgi:hypothetical protein